MTHTTHSEAETNRLAAEFAKRIKPGAIIALDGKLGSGKTVFTKGVARTLGVKERVVSPTFTLMREYPLPGGVGMFYHFDLHRLKSASELKSINLAELLSQKDSIAVIEWPTKAKDSLPAHTQTITFQIIDTTTRKITIPDQSGK